MAKTAKINYPKKKNTANKSSGSKTATKTVTKANPPVSAPAANPGKGGK